MKAADENIPIPFKVAGAYHRLPELPHLAPSNFEFLGHLNSGKLKSFYASCRLIVLPSIGFEAFPIVLVEAMLNGKPVVCSRIGGLPEIVEDGVTGLLFEPGNAKDLADKIRYLWDRPDLCTKMGRAGREKAMREYSPDKYYERLMTAYRKAISLGGRSA
jgi:glycosyltransferase involved in cell wall biosynthesis